MKQHIKCPRCGSRRIKDTGLLPFGYDSVEQRYTCRDCNYTGPLVLDDSREENKEKELINQDLKKIAKEKEKKVKEKRGIDWAEIGWFLIEDVYIILFILSLIILIIYYVVTSQPIDLSMIF